MLKLLQTKSMNKMANKKNAQDSVFESLMRLTGQVAGGTLDLARNTAAMTSMFGESWLRSAVLNKLEPERLEAMADAGHFLRDARETADMSIKDLADSLGISDKSTLEGIESGEKIMPLELMLRSASLLARHDPIPFLIKFMRTYNPALEKTLEQIGLLALPKQYERERRFVNLYRQHDVLRTLSDDEYARFIHYMESSSDLVLDVMLKEKEVNSAIAQKTAEQKSKKKTKAGTKKKKVTRKSSATKRKTAGAKK